MKKSQVIESVITHLDSKRFGGAKSAEQYFLENHIENSVNHTEFDNEVLDAFRIHNDLDWNHYDNFVRYMLLHIRSKYKNLEQKTGE